MNSACPLIFVMAFIGGPPPDDARGAGMSARSAGETNNLKVRAGRLLEGSKRVVRKSASVAFSPIAHAWKWKYSWQRPHADDGDTDNTEPTSNDDPAVKMKVQALGYLGQSTAVDSGHAVETLFASLHDPQRDVRGQVLRSLRALTLRLECDERDLRASIADRVTAYLLERDDRGELVEQSPSLRSLAQTVIEQSVTATAWIDPPVRQAF